MGTPGNWSSDVGRFCEAAKSFGKPPTHRVGLQRLANYRRFPYIFVGTCLRFLQDYREGWLAKGYGKALENIDYFLNSLDSLELHVTKRASDPLVRIRDQIREKPEDYELTKEDAKALTDAADDVRKTFEAETSGVFAYVVTDKRLDIQKLLGKVELLFSPEVFELCPEIAKYDFAEAGKCIAYERPTAASFHILRGTESVLRLFYKRYIRPAQTGLTWGQMTHALSNKPSGKKPDVTILQNLDHIRISFRNPTQHPDKVFDIHEVQDLFGLCIDAVNRMMKAISK